MKESSTLEFKEKYTKTFLKTVSAYANYGTGEILFGVTNEGKVVGVSAPSAIRLAVENAITDALEPCPPYSLKTKRTNGKSVVQLVVMEAPDKPYLCSGKAYRRIDTSTVTVDRSELKRLAIEGSDLPYDEMKSHEQNLTFKTLEKCLKENVSIKFAGKDTLKTLGLYKNGVYNNAAALLADTNNFPGLDIVRYANDDVSIFQRTSCEGTSVLAQLDEAVSEFKNHYIVEQVEGMTRKKKELIPEASFREALANALVHRIWYTNARIIISFYVDRIEIASPGGLPDDVESEVYLAGGVSVPRNATLAFIFLRLGIIERLGTGVKRIMQAYQNSLTKPTFNITGSSIKVTLPTRNSSEEFSKEEIAVIALFSPGLELASTEMEKALKLSRSTVVRTATGLVKKGALRKIGNGRSTRYRLN